MTPNPSASPAIHTPETGEKKASAARAIVQVETNLLRFPFFSLHTKGLRAIDFKEVRGTRMENGQTHEFIFRVSRNTDHFYPGPLSRKAHFAILSLLRQQGFPFRNPVAFTWRQLVREMNVAYSGATTIDRLKEALLSTLGAMIKSTYALKFGPSRESLPTRERGYTLYTECLFSNDPLPDGTLADRNFVTLADWYLANLNALYAAPIDYTMWNRLNDQSPLASRLYEFLLFNFSVGIDTFTINYPKLCQFLPAKVEAYASQAKEQLAPAFRLLTEEGIVGGVVWQTASQGELQLQFTRGVRMTDSTVSSVQPAERSELFETVTTKEGTHQHSPAERLVREFHGAWSGEKERSGSPGEIDAAKTCLELYGLDLAMQLLPKVVKRMREQFPEAKTFGATRSYFAEIHADHLKRDRLIEKAKAANLDSRQEAEAESRRARRRSRLEGIWSEVPESERAAISKKVMAENPRLRLAQFPTIHHRLCLDELEKQT
jgi:hypothetical protein